VQYKVGLVQAGVVAGEFFDGPSSSGLAVTVSGPPAQLIMLRRIGDSFVDAGVYGTNSGGGDNCYNQIAAGDLNGDGRADIVFSDCNLDSIEVFVSQPDGRFSGTTIHMVNRPLAILLADLDGDGLLDLVATKYYGDIAIALGQGDGTFGKETDLSDGLLPDGVAVADFDHDGVLDLAVSNQGAAGQDWANTIRVYPGLGGGQYGQFWSFPGSSDGGYGLNWIATGDLDGDGATDVAATTFPTGDVPLLFGDGHGAFSQDFIKFDPAWGVNAVAFVDVDGDGRQELAVSFQFASKVKILRAQAGVRVPQPWFSISDLVFPQGLVTIPHPNSTVQDLAFVNVQLGDTLTVLVNGCP